MRNSLLTLMIFLFLMLPVSILAQDNAELLRKVEGFSHPESVIVDVANNILYISNIGEKEPGDGFISKVTLDGEILDLKWIPKLNDPKGLLLLDEMLYVTDNTELVVMDIHTAEIKERIEILNSSFLNDITVDEEGAIYISDSGRSAIYKKEPNGDIQEWMYTEELEFPNGLLVVEDKIYVAAWGGDAPGNVLQVDLESKEIIKVTEEGIGNLDGIQLVNGDAFYISNWANGKILKVSMDGNAEEVFTSEKSAGDILFLEQRSQLILPMNHQNAVWWYQLP